MVKTMKKIDFSTKGLITYTMSGYPNLETTLDVIFAMQDAGVSTIELGVPYSDPVADGPVINEAALHALEHGVNLDQIFDLLQKNLDSIRVPIYLMSYYSPIYTYGVEKFIARSLESGVSGAIIPDLPLPAGKSVFELFKKNGLDPILLAFPNTSKDRLKEINQAGGSFLYYVNLFGTTGVRSVIPEESVKALREVRKISTKPVFAGFGISSREMFQSITRESDGAIIGSAIVKILATYKEEPKKGVAEIRNFIDDILA